METDWNEVTRIINPGPAPNTPPSKVTSFAFDTSQELLWTGDEYGRVASFYGPDLQRYTSYRGHVSSTPRGVPGDAPVAQLLFCEHGVISVSSRSVHLSSRKGLAQWHVSRSGMTDLCCMSFTNRNATEIVVSGFQSTMFRIDVEKGAVLDVVTDAAPYALMKLAGPFICAATHDGFIQLLDPRSLTVLHSWKAYTGTVNDMDARGDYLLTCGWAQIQHQGLALERLVRVYNLKTQQPAPPIPFAPGAAHIRIHPKLSSTCIIVSQNGAIHSLDIQNHDIPVMRFANLFDTQLDGLELMPSGRGFALADNDCQIAIWGSPKKLQYTEFGSPTEFAENDLESTSALTWSVGRPLNAVGMPYYREPLLSGWPNNIVHEVGSPALQHHPLNASYRPFEHGHVGPWPGKTRRYEASKMRSRVKNSDLMTAPKFLSEKPREEDLAHEAERRQSEDISKALDSLRLRGTASSVDARLLYRVVEIKYSKFGVEDFDFRYFNKTNYAGLETHIVNSYANPLLQVLRFTNVTRNLALYHTARDCQIANCLLCEVGFLVDMLEKARGPNCQATNFFKALSRQPSAVGNNILEDKTIGLTLTAMLQNLNRFLPSILEMNYKSVASSVDGFHLTFATTGVSLTQCLQCRQESRSDSVWYTHDLIYPPKPKNTQRVVHQPFSQILRMSLERATPRRGWCMKCNGYKEMSSRRVVYNLPAVLSLNAAINGTEAGQLWSTPGFLPREVGVIAKNGRLYCYEGKDLQSLVQRGQFRIMVYELVGVVAEVRASENEKHHLVATLDTGLVDPNPAHDGGWHLFNDFSVHGIPAEEALHFDSKWKLPSVIVYQVKSLSHKLDDSWKNAIDASILYRSPAQPAFSEDYEFRALSEQEPLPDGATHCAIDAEFVRLLREEIDVGADGSRIMTRPARSGLARVSVLRGDGHDQELPFIDDYISIDERIDDHLTKYSGLHDGDLTEGRSRFHLVGLKAVYKKLWILLNLGCTFIGHGLSSDFRIINMHVPEAQVIDTQELFSLGTRTRRKLSLRFLAWVFLGEDIQKSAEAGHDSIEDARTALKLWRKCLEFREAGIFEQKMDEIYQIGRATDFKVPVEKEGRRFLATPTSSNPGTPQKQPARLATPGRSDYYGSPPRRNDFGPIF